MKPKKSQLDSVAVFLGGRKVLLDLENLKDVELAMRDDHGNCESPSGEHHFVISKALQAAKKQNRRLMTKQEYEFLASCRSWWDDDAKGRWFRLSTRKPFTGFLRFFNPLILWVTGVNVYFPASGYRDYFNGALVYVGTDGYYLAASLYSRGGSGASYFYFLSGTVYVYFTANRANGNSVRCVRDIPD